VTNPKTITLAQFTNPFTHRVMVTVGDLSKNILFGAAALVVVLAIVAACLMYSSTSFTWSSHRGACT
jgi:hypothetical protein